MKRKSNLFKSGRFEFWIFCWFFSQLDFFGVFQFGSAQCCCSPFLCPLLIFVISCPCGNWTSLLEMLLGLLQPWRLNPKNSKNLAQIHLQPIYNEGWNFWHMCFREDIFFQLSSPCRNFMGPKCKPSCCTWKEAIEWQKSGGPCQPLEGKGYDTWCSLGFYTLASKDIIWIF